jgi:hypothetical protein
LLLTDRLYGCGAFLLPAWAKLQSLGSHFLARVKLGLSIQRQIKRLSDGSRIVEIQAVDPENKRRVTGTMQVREIKATIKRKGYRTVQLRLWTSLLDEQLYPAEELVRLYAARWEQELYFRELKSELKLNNLLQSQTPETAAQEVAAIIIGSSLRLELGPGRQEKGPASIKPVSQQQGFGRQLLQQSLGHFPFRFPLPAQAGGQRIVHQQLD